MRLCDLYYRGISTIKRSDSITTVLTKQQFVVITYDTHGCGSKINMIVNAESIARAAYISSFMVMVMLLYILP